MSRTAWLEYRINKTGMAICGTMNGLLALENVASCGQLKKQIERNFQFGFRQGKLPEMRSAAIGIKRPA